jgi:hypothetical protein
MSAHSLKSSHHLPGIGALSMPHNARDELQAKAARPLLFFLQRA